MKKLLIISFIFGLLAATYNITHVNYQIERRTMSEMDAAYAIVHLKWEHGILGNPMQYRALVEFLVSKLSPKYIIKTNDGRIYETNFSPVVLELLKFVVIVPMFVLLAIYYRKLGSNGSGLFIGIFTFFIIYIIAVSNESISLNSYIDLTFFLITSLIVLYDKSWLWILSFMPIATFNRETCFFIPSIIASLIYFKKGKPFEYLKPIILLCVWLIIFISLRNHFPNQTVQNFGPNGAVMSGGGLLRDNLTNINSLALWLVFPLSAAYLYFTKKKFVHQYLLQGVALPMLAMTCLSFYGGTINEIRVFIIPISIFLIPLLIAEKENRK